MFRRIGSVVLGLLMGVFVVAAGEMVGHALWPPPPGLDATNPEHLARLMQEIPKAALVAVVVSWALGAFAGGAVAARVGKSIGPAIIVGVILLAAGVMTMIQIPHPAWMWACGVLVPIPAAWLGARLALPRPAQAA